MLIVMEARPYLTPRLLYSDISRLRVARRNPKRRQIQTTTSQQYGCRIMPLRRRFIRESPTTYAIFHGTSIYILFDVQSTLANLTNNVFVERRAASLVPLHCHSWRRTQARRKHSVSIDFQSRESLERRLISWYHCELLDPCSLARSIRQTL